PTGQRRTISPVVMRITFPTGNVDIPAGTSVLLGRDPAESLVAAAFARFDNVSRRHATVQVDDAGHATIRDENSTNGTYVNDDRVLPGAEVRLVDGDRVRLGAVVPHLMLPWQYAIAASCGLFVVAAVLRVSKVAGRSASWALWGGVAWESALLFVLYGLWQFAGSFTVMGTSGALPRARWLWDAERILYLPSETDLQRLLLPHPLLVQAGNYYYDV